MDVTNHKNLSWKSLLVSGGILAVMFACEPDTTREQAYRNPTAITDTDRDAALDGWPQARSDAAGYNPERYLLPYRELNMRVTSRINRWQAEIEGLDPQDREQLSAQIQQLRQRQDTLHLRMEEYMQTTEDRRTEAEPSLATAAQDLESFYNDMIGLEDPAQ
jgi:hypothetical protein